MAAKAIAPVYTVEFQPLGRHGACGRRETILDCARRLGVGISNVCGGAGTCGSCRVQVLSGAVSESTSVERQSVSARDLKAGWRLACQCYPRGDVRLNIPPESLTTGQRTQVEGLAVEVKPEPPVKAYNLSIPPPTLNDLRGDVDRLMATLNETARSPFRLVDPNVMRPVPVRLREWGWRCEVIVRDREVVAVRKGGGPRLGLAVDLGSTKIAAYLVDLETGKTIASRGIANPQISYGDDVITRITYAMASPENAQRLQSAVIDALNETVESLCGEARSVPGDILEAVVVGNTAMHHLFLRLPVQQLARSPFVPAVSRALDIRATALGLHIAPGAYVHLLPNIAGFVGADHVAVLLAAEPWRLKGAAIVIDIGTNTEVSLCVGGKITAASCASGPAFEGGHISHGMRAARGAIERVRVQRDAVQVQTIDDAPPAGICGSGILDTLAQLHLAGVVDERGRLLDSHPRVRETDSGREFVLVAGRKRGRDIVVTQRDIRELQLAKAAIRTGIQSLLESGGLTNDDIRHVIIAGAFGSYIDVGSAIAVGMLPPLPLAHFRQVGNAAGTGARLALVSMGRRRVAQQTAAHTHYLELATRAGFTQTLAQSTRLGRYHISGGKLLPAQDTPSEST